MRQPRAWRVPSTLTNLALISAGRRAAQLRRRDETFAMSPHRAPLQHADAGRSQRQEGTRLIGDLARVVESWTLMPSHLLNQQFDTVWLSE